MAYSKVYSENHLNERKLPYFPDDFGLRSPVNQATFFFSDENGNLYRSTRPLTSPK